MKFNKNGIHMHTYNGTCFSPLDPIVENIEIDVIAHSLSNQCRFNGLCRDFYSVAQHSVIVSEYIEKVIHIPSNENTYRFNEFSHERTHVFKFAMAGLLHDASEAFIADIPRPLKYSSIFREYIPLEEKWAKCVSTATGIGMEYFNHPLIKEADDVVLIVEARDLLGSPMRIDDIQDGFTSVAMREPYIDAIGPKDAKKLFLDRYYSLQNKIYNR